MKRVNIHREWGSRFPASGLQEDEPQAPSAFHVLRKLELTLALVESKNLHPQKAKVSLPLVIVMASPGLVSRPSWVHSSPDNPKLPSSGICPESGPLLDAFPTQGPPEVVTREVSKVESNANLESEDDPTQPTLRIRSESWVMTSQTLAFSLGGGDG